MAEVLRNEKGQIMPGYTANPNGRPKNKTFRDYFDADEEADLINKVKQALNDRPEILKMAIEQIFGKPKQQMEMSGELKVTKQIYGGVSKRTSDEESVPAEETDQSSSGGNISEQND